MTKTKFRTWRCFKQDNEQPIHLCRILRFIVLVPCSFATCERSCAMLIVIPTYLPLKTITYKNKLCNFIDLILLELH